MRRWWLALLAVLVLAGGGAGAVWLTTSRASPVSPVGSPSPTPVPTRTPLLPAATSGPVTPTGLRTALARALADPALGGRVSIAVVRGDGSTVADQGARRLVTPASTAKIATAVAALTVLPPDLRLRTQVVRGSGPGDVVLVGGGDPTLGGRFATAGYPGTASLAELARHLSGVTRVLVDDTRYAGPRLAPGWKPSYVTTGNVAPVSALEVDEGRSAPTGPRSQDPALAAGRQFAALLHVKTPVVRGTAAAGAEVLAHVDSAPVTELVEAMLTRSDNDLAEALGRQVARAAHQPASFAGAAVAIRAALQRLGVNGLALRDASGLSPLDRVTPLAVAQLLAKAAGDPAYAPLLSGLPVAGFDGTLSKRYRQVPTSAAAGVIRAKTGTLDGVSALAGLVTTRTGGVLAFDITADRVSSVGTLAAEAALDRVATVLASCGCA
ncbi:MAG: D-alanyl-D-alanine carboxypeptidase (penicillin-binding protein 4)-like protein [Frankiales bacterium]|nr:D-alanyl-D-alanine carboxypeptidase (penicillin-binding protein 4)-like protein [Frankiales bacterium]